MPDTIQFISNSIDDFESGGLYPGGTGIATEFKYSLWDYDGRRPPNSQIAVHVLFSPTDGSNEGKLVDIWWSVGPASDFTPDPNGGRLIPVKNRVAQSVSSNWGFVQSKFRDNCGFSGADQSKYLNTEKGLRILDGMEMTVARVDQPKRAGLDDDDSAKEKLAKGYKREILVPTRIRLPWEKGARKVTAPVQTSAATSATSPAATESSSPNGVVPSDLTSALAKVLAASDNAINFDEIPAKLLEVVLTGMDRTLRMAMLRAAKDSAQVAAAAKAQGWVFDGKELMAV